MRLRVGRRPGPGVPGEPSGGAPPVSRAGRDLRAAIIVGVLLGTAILVPLFTVRYVFIGVVGVAVAIATLELAGALRRGAGIRITRLPVVLGGQAMLWLAWPFGMNGVLIAFTLTAVTTLLWRFRGGADGYVRDVTASVFVAAYVPLLASFAALLVVAPDGAARVLCFMLVGVFSDIGGYVAGVLRGRHPMAPSISPKKTWEGFAGSIVAGVLAGALVLTFLLDGQWWQGVLVGVALVVVASAGDLVESLIKRDLGIKDMGSILPGHGGFMDRLDSLLPSAAMAWILLSLFIPVG